MRSRYLALIALLGACLLIVAACGGSDATATPTRTTAPATSTSKPAASPTTGASSTPTKTAGSPTAAATGAAGSPTAAASPGAEGDAAAGQALFAANGCSGCHSTGTNTIVGPGLAGVAERAATRIPGLTADEYMHQSIVDSQAFLVPGFPPAMPPSFPNLTDQDVNDLIAYLKTLQ